MQKRTDLVSKVLSLDVLATSELDPWAVDLTESRLDPHHQTTLYFQGDPGTYIYVYISKFKNISCV